MLTWTSSGSKNAKQRQSMESKIQNLKYPIRHCPFLVKDSFLYLASRCLSYEYEYEYEYSEEEDWNHDGIESKIPKASTILQRTMGGPAIVSVEDEFVAYLSNDSNTKEKEGMEWK